MGRLFDTAAALTGFTHEMTYEGQATVWLEAHARRSPAAEPYPFPFDGRQIDFRPLLGAIIEDRRRGRDTCEIAYAFHAGVAGGLVDAALVLCDEYRLDTVVLSGGVFQNELLLEHTKERLLRCGLRLWTNRAVPPNDGGIRLGQAALAALCDTVPVAIDSRGTNPF